MNTGQKTIEWLYREQLRVDEEWSVRSEKGFTWWADQNAQRVEIVGNVSDRGGEGWLIRVKTELVRDLTLDDKALTGIGAVLMPVASMAGPVYDFNTRTLCLSSMVRIHEEIRPWMAPMIGMACALQVGEARIMGPLFAEMFGGEFAVSGPQGGGLRPVPDELAEVIAKLVAPAGKLPSPWSGNEFKQAVEQHMMKPPSCGATFGRDGLTVEFPYGDSTSLCAMAANQPHPRYGNGLLVLQRFPVQKMDCPAGARLALELNTGELDGNPADQGYGFGSYCYRDAMIHYCAFLPNAVFLKGLLGNLYFSCAARARKMSQQFKGDDWSELAAGASRETRDDFFARIARRFGLK